jgi:hypothetical protein
LVIDLSDIKAPVFKIVVAESQKESRYQGLYPSFLMNEVPSQEQSTVIDKPILDQDDNSLAEAYVALSKEDIERLMAEKGYVCDRCDRKWVRTHHEKCPRRGVFGNKRPSEVSTDAAIPPVVVPPDTSGIKEASVRKRISRKQETPTPKAKGKGRYDDPDAVVEKKDDTNKSLSNGKDSTSTLPADVPKPQSTGVPDLSGVEDESKSSNTEPAATHPSQDGDQASREPPAFPKTLQKLHSRLMNDLELYKLHVKHYHMPLAQFKRRTDQLFLPKQVYDKYESVCSQRKVCATRRPAPIRSRVTGLS